MTGFTDRTALLAAVQQDLQCDVAERQRRDAALLESSIRESTAKQYRTGVGYYEEAFGVIKSNQETASPFPAEDSKVVDQALKGAVNETRYRAKAPKRAEPLSPDCLAALKLMQLDFLGRKDQIRSAALLEPQQRKLNAGVSGE
ncbi:hypothetical protein FOL47_001604, partial [Perkinsus chesapeaki]